MGISQMIDGIGNYVDSTFQLIFFFLKIWSRDVLTMFVGSYFYETVYVIEYDSTILTTKLPMTVIFTFSFDGNFMEREKRIAQRQ